MGCVFAPRGHEFQELRYRWHSPRPLRGCDLPQVQLRNCTCDEIGGWMQILAGATDGNCTGWSGDASGELCYNGCGTMSHGEVRFSEKRIRYDEACTPQLQGKGTACRGEYRGEGVAQAGPLDWCVLSPDELSCVEVPLSLTTTCLEARTGQASYGGILSPPPPYPHASGRTLEPPLPLPPALPSLSSPAGGAATIGAAVGGGVACFLLLCLCLLRGRRSSS